MLRVGGHMLFGGLCLALVGCGPSMGQVAGQITVGTAPVREGVIMFTPEDGPTALGTIQADGSYTLTTSAPGDGAVVGKHRVVIQAVKAGPGRLTPAKSLDEEIAHSGRQGQQWLVAGEVSWVVPEKYAQLHTTDLTAEVKSGANKIDFHLPR